jgi:hypothetical protein
MKKRLIILILAVQFFNAYTQAIKGYVYDMQEKTPLEFANVVVLSLPDSAMVKGLISYHDGQYAAEMINPGIYYVKASFIGYEDAGKRVELSDEQDEIWADTIFLALKPETIEDVVITGNYVRAQELVDRTVYEILPEIEKTSTNGFDVLRKIPSVQVDFNNNVTLNGKSNFIIQVDGKQRDKEFLARILPGDIESVEVIHNPSGRYEGDIEGVINVVLKPEARMGINGLIGMQAKPINRTTVVAIGSLDYGLEKVTFYISGYSFIQNLNASSEDYNRFTLPSETVPVDSILDMAGAGDYRIAATAINAGFDYYMNKNNTLSINYSFKPFSIVINTDNFGDISMDGTLMNTQQNETNIATGSSESNVSLFFRKKFKKPIQEFIIESNYYFFNSSDDNDFTHLLYPTLGQIPSDSSSRHEWTINDRDYFSTKIDYIQPIGVDMRLEAGYQFYLQWIDYNYKTHDAANNNIYNYGEFRNAGYASFYWKLKKFSLQNTIRIENSQIDINNDIHLQYTTFLPSTNLMYKLNAKHTLKLTYNRRINRPNIYQLNPYEKLNNDFSISTGNPYLEPELKDKLQLTYTLNIKKLNLSPYIYHEFYTNKIDSRSTLGAALSNGTLSLITSPENLLTGYEQGFGLSSTYSAININGSIYRGHFNAWSDSISTIPANDYSSFRINSFVIIPLFKKKLNVFTFLNYNGVRRSAQTTAYSPALYGIGAQQNIKNHAIGLFYMLPFSKTIRLSKVITETPTIYSKNTQYFDVSWFIQILYSYKFNKGRAIKKSGHEAEIESDTKGGGLGR